MYGSDECDCEEPAKGSNEATCICIKEDECTCLADCDCDQCGNEHER